jgi:hypothetical protein
LGWGAVFAPFFCAESKVTIFIVITKDRQPRSFRWAIRLGVNQPNEIGPSRAESGLSMARRGAERVFGPLVWIDAEAAGRDERNQYVVQVAAVEVVNGGNVNGSK